MGPTKTPIPEQALLARLRRGDEAALAELYDEFGAGLYTLARSMLGESADAEEVVGDAFMRLWENPDSYSPERGSIRAFLTVITRSKALDRIRSRKRRLDAMTRAAETDEQGIATPTSSFGTSPETGVERSELRDALQRCLASLPEAQRLALELSYFRGLTHSEIAAEVSEPLGTVKTRIRDGMKKLRGALAPFRTEGAR